MSDDLVPEEREQEYNELLAMLRSASHRRTPIEAREQEQIVAQVRERLAQTTSTSPSSDVGTLASHGQSIPRPPEKQTKTSRRFVANLLVALAVIGLALGSWVFLFRAYPFSNGTPGSNGTPAPSQVSEPTVEPTAQAEANGLEASIHVLVPGPYFVSELLLIDISFTNHTQQPASLEGTLKIVNNGVATLCYPPELLVHITAGDDSHYSLPQIDAGCTQPAVGTPIGPGQTLTIRQYLPLTKIDKVTLTRGMRSQADPFNEQWPTVQTQIQVNTQIPQDRMLSQLNQGGQVTISGPAEAMAHLLFTQSVICSNDYSSTDWTHLPTNVLPKPACPSANLQWAYLVGAPGYTIVSSNQTTP